MNLNDAWNSEEAKPKKYDRLPDGKYQCEVISCRDETNKNDNRLIAWELVVNGDEYHGRRIFHNRYFSKNPENLAKSVGFIRQDFYNIGIEDIPSPDALSDACQKALDMVIEVTLKTNLKNVNQNGEPVQNVYFNRALGFSAGIPASGNYVPPSDDIPF